MVFSRDYLVHYYETDHARRLTLPSLMRYFEDIAILHSEERGIGLDYYERAGVGWMLMKWDVSIRSMPSFRETVRVSTEVHAMKRFLADRVFELRGADGSVLAEARSNWLFVDTAKRRPARIAEEQYGKFGVSPESESSFVAIDDVEPVANGIGREITVRASFGDIDTNRHVNNVSYLEWALDSLAPETFFGHSPATMRAHYRKELAIGMEALVRSDFGPMAETAAGSATARSRHSVRSPAGEDLCSFEIGWKAQPPA